MMMIMIVRCFANDGVFLQVEKRTSLPSGPACGGLHEWVPVSVLPPLDARLPPSLPSTCTLVG